ncbi:MAG TPA: hypothetical protein VFE54_05795 [Mucilaginibacter sp.]|jgi:hypothetical protein|nr:hypothetical protein [Mucilaginibacter sp.]
MGVKPRSILDVLGIDVTPSKREELANARDVDIGSMFIEDDLISHNCILENTLYRKSDDILFFVKYHRLNYYGWFTLNFYDLKSKTGYEFCREFEMLYLKEFINENEIHVYESFNDRAGNNFHFNLDEEEFNIVS